MDMEYKIELNWENMDMEYKKCTYLRTYTLGTYMWDGEILCSSKFYSFGYIILNYYSGRVKLPLLIIYKKCNINYVGIYT